MPILPLETFVNPNELFEDTEIHEFFEDIEIQPERNDRWTAIYTKPKAEKALARRLLARDISFFLPLYKRQVRRNGRTQRAYLPLFPGYLFLRGDDHNRVHALETNLVLRTLWVEDQARIDADLAQVYRLMESGATLAPEERLQPGTRVEIISGPLAGMVGTILRRNNKTRFALEVKFLQSAVSADVEGWMIRPLTHPS